MILLFRVDDATGENSTMVGFNDNELDDVDEE